MKMVSAIPLELLARFDRKCRSTFSRVFIPTATVFASIAAVRLFLRARTVINFVMRAASTLDITKGESEHFVIFLQLETLLLSKRCSALSNLADTFKIGQHVTAVQHSQQLTANYALFDMPFDAKLL